MSNLKSKIRNFLVHRNFNIRVEYEFYLGKKALGHGKLKKLWTLFRLNMHYRIFRSKKPFFNDGPKAKVKKFPYLKGAESLLSRRVNPIGLTKMELMSYDVVSFDIFDTLVVRNVSGPKDLFLVIGNKLGILYFKDIRANAEIEAREEMFEREGHREITIYDIYNIISRKTGIDVEKGVQAELETEREFCFANPYMKRVFNILKDQGKEIIITSDMYIPHDEMEKLLSSCGYEGYSKLRVSCDYKCNKRYNGLYNILLKDYAGKKIVHIGDNAESDIASAKRSGIRAIYYKNCHEIGNEFRASGMSEVIGSVYGGIVNTHLHNGLKTYSPHYEYGFLYGGLYIYGFCNWIYKKAKTQGVEKILFLARDGDIYKKVFDMMFDDMPNEYVYWSRIANLKYTAEKNREDLITRITTHKARNIVPVTLKDTLYTAGLGDLVGELANSNLKANEILSEKNSKDFENFIVDHYDDALKLYERETNYALTMLEKSIGKSKRIAIVDVGWLGSGPLGVKTLIESKSKNKIDIKCYIVGSTNSNPYKNINELMNETLETYIFSPIYNKDLFNIHSHTNGCTNSINFEMFAQAEHPSFAGYSDDGGYRFDVPEVVNYEMTREIQKGIMDFCELYHRATEKNTYLRNVSGRDAYMPFAHAIKDVRLVKSLFSKVSFSRNVGVNVKAQKQETYVEILKGVNL